MIEVIPLKYGTAFKRVFSQPEVFTSFAQDVKSVKIRPGSRCQSVFCCATMKNAAVKLGGTLRAIQMFLSISYHRWGCSKMKYYNFRVRKNDQLKNKKWVCKLI